MNILDPIGIFKQHKVKDIMKQSAFKMKGYSYPGISPIKQYDYDKVYRGQKKKDPVFVESPQHEVELSKRIHEKKIATRKVNKEIKRKETFAKIGDLAETEVGQAVISNVVSSILTPKPKKEITRMLPKNWKIIS